MTEESRISRALPAESALRSITVTLIVCGVCSAAIATSVTLLRPYQEANRAAERTQRIRAIVASVPGLPELAGLPDGERLEARAVELDTGRYDPQVDPLGLDPRAGADAQHGWAIPAKRDLAGLGWRPSHAAVYLVRDDAEALRLVLLPFQGAGYVSTIYGYLALDADGNTIRGITFYEHSETPGLGAEIEDSRWREQWIGKRARDASGALRIEVARGNLEPGGAAAAHQVDGLSGATRTGQSVTNMLRFWLGPEGFGPYLDRLAALEPASGTAP